MEEMNQPGGLWAGVGSAIVGVIVGALWLINKISSSSADRANDRAEVNIIQVLQDQNAKLREELDKSDEERRSYFQKYVESNSQVTLLTEQMTQLTKIVGDQNQQIDLLKKEVSRLSEALEKKNGNGQAY